MTSYGIAEPLLELIKRGVRDVLHEEWSARPPIQPRLLDAKQAGDYIGRPEASVRKLAREKRIRVSSSDSRILFDRLDLDNFVECEKDVGHAG